MPIHTQGFGKISEVIALVAGLVLFLVLVYLILPVLTPFIVLMGILFLFYPARQHLYVRRIMWLAVLLFVVWFFTFLTGVLTPFLIALTIAYLFNPVINALERRNIPRWLSSLILMFVILGSIVAAVLLLVPLIISQFKNIVDNVSVYVREASRLLNDGTIQSLLARYGISVGEISREIPVKLEGFIRTFLEGAFGIFTSITSIISRLVDAVVIPFVAFYLLKDFPHLRRKIISFIPFDRRAAIRSYFSHVDDLIGAYVRGTLLVSALQAVLVAAGCAIIGIGDALVLGVVAGLLNVIPVVGLLLSLAITVILAILSGGVVTAKVVAVIALFLGLNVLQNVVFVPKIVGEQVGLHPVVLILSLTVFGYLFGFVGLLVAVPVTAILIHTVTMWQDSTRQVPAEGDESA